nr:DJ-1/PfpI family protein [Actinopolymorpha cephalotaxi]
MVVGYPAAEALDIACVVSTLQIANYVRGRHEYRVELAALSGGMIRTATGLTLQADAPLERVKGPLDTLVVSGGIGYMSAMEDQQLVAHVRRLARESRRVASVCTGAGVLAAAGLLDGRRAATHWDHAEFLSTRFPAVRFDPAPIYLVEDSLCTSAGVTAALDLCLSFIESDTGPDVARAVARQLVTYMQRPGNQAQMSVFTATTPRNSVVRQAVEFIETHLGENLTPALVAQRVGVSERHLSRLFTRELTVSAARFIRRRRTSAAAQLLADTDLTQDAVAARVGFRTVETMRQAFQHLYGVSPSHFQATQRSTRHA